MAIRTCDLGHMCKALHTAKWLVQLGFRVLTPLLIFVRILLIPSVVRKRQFPTLSD